MLHAIYLHARARLWLHALADLHFQPKRARVRTASEKQEKIVQMTALRSASHATLGIKRTRKEPNAFVRACVLLIGKAQLHCRAHEHVWFDTAVSVTTSVKYERDFQLCETCASDAVACGQWPLDSKGQCKYVIVSLLEMRACSLVLSWSHIWKATDCMSLFSSLL